MKLLRPTHCVLIVLTALVLVPTKAEAHLVSTGLGPFYDGALHLVLSPNDLLGLFAAAALAGLCGRKAGRATVMALPFACLIGAIVGLRFPEIPVSPGLSILAFVALGLLVALDVKLHTWCVATCVGLLGLLQGLLNGIALSAAPERILNLLGILTLVFVLALLISSAVVALRPAWARIAVRVAGSWVVAVGMLMFGWMYRNAFG